MSVHPSVLSRSHRPTTVSSVRAMHKNLVLLWALKFKCDISIQRANMSVRREYIDRYENIPIYLTDLFPLTVLSARRRGLPGVEFRTWLTGIWDSWYFQYNVINNIRPVCPCSAHVNIRFFICCYRTDLEGDKLPLTVTTQYRIGTLNR